ncbi:uncharacterized protein LOC119284114 [Triticum dicoccoides]|uniref:uncharacterized protein LOC119284114 n=1 Tax=Triticum dicoccoides TaxID=85692 RepID=UPI00188E7107|nr:uncharacterized protein LOC119284114 [Triticum dicoccoides]
MADIENPLPAAATAEPSRNGFWAWKERFVLNHLTLYNPADDDDATNGVASADADQDSRRRFLWGSTLLAIFIELSTALLIASIEPSTAGPAVYLASRVVGYAGQIISVCWGLLLLHLWQAQPHVLILTNCTSTQTSSSRSCLTCLASVSRSRRRIFAPASPTTSHTRSCNRRTEELLLATSEAATDGQRSYKPGTKQTTAVLDSARRGAATGRSNGYNYLLFLLRPVRNFAVTIDACSFGESSIYSPRIHAQLVLCPNSTMRAALARGSIYSLAAIPQQMACHGRRSARSAPLVGENNHHRKMPQPRRGGATSVGPGAATSKTNDGTGDDRAASATAAVHHCWNQLFFCWNYHYFLLELHFFVAAIN